MQYIVFIVKNLSLNFNRIIVFDYKVNVFLTRLAQWGGRGVSWQIHPNRLHFRAQVYSAHKQTVNSYTHTLIHTCRLCTLPTPLCKVQRAQRSIWVKSLFYHTTNYIQHTIVKSPLTRPDITIGKARHAHTVPQTFVYHYAEPSSHHQIPVDYTNIRWYSWCPRSFRPASTKKVYNYILFSLFFTITSNVRPNQFFCYKLIASNKQHLHISHKKYNNL